MMFAAPLWLLAALPILGLIFWSHKKKKTPTIATSDAVLFQKIEKRSTKHIASLARYLRYITLLLMVITLARPQWVQVETENMAKGIDIMLVLDTSGSMAAEDFKPNNRLAVAKQTMASFIANRKTDRIGLVVFGSDAYTQCPLTTDYRVLESFIGAVHVSMAGEGTALGTALITGLNRLKKSEAHSKVMVLLTDGNSNAGRVDPIQAAELARDMGVKVYTIGIGTDQVVPIPYNDPVYGAQYLQARVDLDEDTLKTIASETQGYYFKATEASDLTTIYEQIDKMEKTDIKTQSFVEKQDIFPVLLWMLVGLLVLEWVIVNMIVVVIP